MQGLWSRSIRCGVLVLLFTVGALTDGYAQQGATYLRGWPGAGEQVSSEVAARDAAQRATLADAVIALRESARGRNFDSAFRASLKSDLLRLPVATLESLQNAGGEGNIRQLLAKAPPSVNALGDTSADLVFTPLTPCRLLDTRLAGGIMTPGASRAFLVNGLTTDLSPQGGSATGCGVPDGATAVAVNFGATQSAGPGNLRAYAWASPDPGPPLAAVLNFGNLAPDLVTQPGASIVPLCDQAATTCTNDLFLQVLVSNTHLVADVTGYFAPVDKAGVKSAVQVSVTDVTFTGLDVTCTNVPAATIAFNVPGPGVLLVRGRTLLQLPHVNGSGDRSDIFIGTTAADCSSPLGAAGSVAQGAALPTEAEYYHEVTAIRLLPVTAGITNVYLNGLRFAGNSSAVVFAAMDATFIPD